MEKNYDGLTKEEIVQRKKEEEEAATMIQARYKGNKTRTNMKEKKREKEKEFAIQELEKNYDGLTKEEIV